MSNESYPLPLFLQGNNVLVPIRLDLSFKGARLIDSFCYNIVSPCQSLEELTSILCNDYNLPTGFFNLIYLQLKEQILAYKLLLKTIYYFPYIVKNYLEKLNEIQIISIGFRFNSIDYSDKIEWHPLKDSLSPEEYATLTCSDLGLPSEIIPTLSYKIREGLFRWLLNLFLYSNSINNMNLKLEFHNNNSTSTKVVINNSINSYDMLSSLWKRAKPNSYEEILFTPQPFLPNNKYSNSFLYEKILNITDEKKDKDINNNNNDDEEGVFAKLYSFLNSTNPQAIEDGITVEIKPIN